MKFCKPTNFGGVIMSQERVLKSKEEKLGKRVNTRNPIMCGSKKMRATRVSQAADVLDRQLFLSI